MSPSHDNPSGGTQFVPLATHNSNLQTRLLATLDALNELQRCHQSELDEFRTQVDRLRARSHLLKQRAKAAEAERDELRMDIHKLVEKDPIPVPVIGPLSADPISQADPYFPTVVSYLTSELTAERQAFAEFKQSSEERIAILKEQVAHRDAELQKHVLQSCTYPASATHPDPAHALQSHGAPLTQEQLHDALDQAALKNRALEVEVRGLADKLEKARESAFRSRQSADPTRHRPQAGQSSPPLGSHTEPPSLVPAQDIASHTVLSDIDRQIKGNGQEIGELQQERHNLAAVLNLKYEQHADLERSREDFQGVLLLEEECIRLRRSQRELRQELLLSRATVAATEQELRAQIEQLQRQVDELGNSKEEQVLFLGEQDMGVEDGSFVVETMDETARPNTSLSSPVQRTTPPLQTLPSWVHPTRESSSPPITPPRGREQLTALERLARFESELNQAREEVERKDRSIEALRTQLQAFGVAIQRRRDGEG